METEKQEKTTGEALVIKGALKGSGLFPFNFEPPKCVMVMAGESVCINFSLDLKEGLKFTLDQWNQIVEFVSEQIAPKEETPSWEIDWSELSSRWMFAAIDENRQVCVYNVKPQIDARKALWVCGNNGDFLQLEVKAPGNVDWTQSLIKRPIQMPKHANCSCHVNSH